MTTRAFNLVAECILPAISDIGIDSSAAFLDADFCGGQCHVFKVSFGNTFDVSITVRVPLYRDGGSQNLMIEALTIEMRNLDFLESKGFHWSPRCRGYSLTCNNAIQLSFLVLTGMDGSMLKRNEESPLGSLRSSILEQIVHLQLCEITAKAHFERLLKNRHARVAEGKLPGLTNQDCLDQQAMLANVLGGAGADTALAMDNGDLKPESIIVDENHKIKGLIDWPFAAQVPLLRAAGLPRFLWPVSFSEGSETSVQRDRRDYLACLASLSDSSSSQQVLPCMQRWQIGSNIGLHTLYLESLFSKWMHRELAKAGWGSLKLVS